MAIIRYTKDASIRYAYLNIFPDQFKTEKQKRDDSWARARPTIAETNRLNTLRM